MITTQVAVVGSFVQDLAFKVQQFPAAGETRIGEFFSGPGGKGSNQAVACHRQGVGTLFVGAVGSDLFGDGFRQWAANEQLPVDLLNADAPTGAASIVINSEAQNLIVVALGANAHLTPKHVLAALSRNRDLMVVVLQAESNLEAAGAALEYAQRAQILSLFNPAPINPGIAAEMVAYADIITPNETEAAFLAQHILGEKRAVDIMALDDESLVALCSQLPSKATLITLGASGSVFYQRSVTQEKFRGVKSGELIRTPVVSGILPVDTTGAGDAFNGGLAAGLVYFDGDIRRSIKYATVVAGLSTQRNGTAPAMPTRAEVEEYRYFYQQ
jgi:ribokinase